MPSDATIQYFGGLMPAGVPTLPDEGGYNAVKGFLVLGQVIFGWLTGQPKEI
jgi:hypothetical protein